MSEPGTTTPAASATDTVGRSDKAPSGVLGRIDRALDVASTAIATLCIWLVSALLLVMLASITFQVVARYWVHTVVGAPEEIARLCMVTMVFMALPALAAILRPREARHRARIGQEP